MRGGIGVRSSQLALAVACIAAVALIVLIAAHTSPVADDYGDIALIGHAGALKFLQSFWLHLTDRYSDAVFTVVLIKPLGAAAIHIATPLLVAALFGFCVVTARSIDRSDHSLREAGTVGSVGAVAIACA